jgi:hypothetical protein
VASILGNFLLDIQTYKAATTNLYAVASFPGGITTPAANISTLTVTNLTTSGTIHTGLTISGSGFTNTLGVTIQGYLNITNSSSWTNFNNAGTAWSTLTGPGTNISFVVQSGGKITTAANALDIAHVAYSGL